MRLRLQVATTSLSSRSLCVLQHLLRLLFHHLTGQLSFLHFLHPLNIALTQSNLASGTSTLSFVLAAVILCWVSLSMGHMILLENCQCQKVEPVNCFQIWDCLTGAPLSSPLFLHSSWVTDLAISSGKPSILSSHSPVSIMIFVFSQTAPPC